VDYLRKGKVKVNRVWPLVTSLTATGTHVPYGITQYYLPPGRGDISALTQPKLNDLMTLNGYKAELT